MANRYDMMHMETNGDTTAPIAAISAFSTCVIVPPEDRRAKHVVFVGLSNAVRVASPIPMVFSFGDKIRVSVSSETLIPGELPLLAGHPSVANIRVIPDSVIDVAPVAEGFVARLKSHAVKRGMISLFKPTVPTSVVLVCPTFWVMPAHRGRDIIAASILYGNGYRNWPKCLTAPAIADRINDLWRWDSHTRSCHAKNSKLLKFPVQGSDARKQRELLENLEDKCATTWPVMASVNAPKAFIMRQSAAKRPGNRPKVRRLGELACTARMAKHPRARWPLRGVRYSLDCVVTRRREVQTASRKQNRPYTGFLDNLSKHPVQEIINKVLKNDAKKGLDGQAWYQFLQTPLRVVASGTGTLGTSTISVTLTTNGVLQSAREKYR
jgi:hypothetical protein